MNAKPYAVEINCPFSDRKEEVYFFEVPLGEEFRLQFNGCDNSWHKCEECEVCRQKAYDKLIGTIR